MDFRGEMIRPTPYSRDSELWWVRREGEVTDNKEIVWIRASPFFLLLSCPCEASDCRLQSCLGPRQPGVSCSPDTGLSTLSNYIFFLSLATTAGVLSTSEGLFLWFSTPHLCHQVLAFPWRFQAHTKSFLVFEGRPCVWPVPLCLESQHQPWWSIAGPEHQLWWSHTCSSIKPE